MIADRPRSRLMTAALVLGVSLLLFVTAIVLSSCYKLRTSAALFADWTQYELRCKSPPTMASGSTLRKRQSTLATPLRYQVGGSTLTAWNAYGYVDSSGEWDIAPQFLTASEFSEGRAAVQSVNGWGFIDTTGSWILAPGTIDFGASFSDGLARIYARRGRGHLVTFGYIDRSGSIAVPLAFDHATDFCGGRALVGDEPWWSEMVSSLLPGLHSPWKPRFYYWIIDRSGARADLPSP